LRPECGKGHPEQAVSSAKTRPRRCALQGGGLLPERAIFSRISSWCPRAATASERPSNRISSSTRGIPALVLRRINRRRRDADVGEGHSVGEVQSEKGTHGEVFGKASRPTRRAQVFYDRIYDHPMQTGSNVAMLLGAVIAHAVGHLLLPAFSHSATGIMRAYWEGPVLYLPHFRGDQARTIRTLLADAGAK
jgi:hypothetical protein